MTSCNILWFSFNHVVPLPLVSFFAYFSLNIDIPYDLLPIFCLHTVWFHCHDTYISIHPAIHSSRHSFIQHVLSATIFQICEPGGGNSKMIKTQPLIQGINKCWIFLPIQADNPSSSTSKIKPLLIPNCISNQHYLFLFMVISSFQSLRLNLLNLPSP